MELSAGIRKRAKELGFSECRIIRIQPLTDEKARFENWLRQGMHGEMDYMARNVEKRINPALLLDHAKSMVIVIKNYATEKKQADPAAPVVSKYAYGDDYHDVMRGKLVELLKYIRENVPGSTGRVFVDSAPILERAYGRKAGLGWIGKNSSLISPEYGSFFFIGEILFDSELLYDEPKIINDHCGTCTRCMDACPTKAIVAKAVVDARRCISYQTIENKGDLDIAFKGLFGNRIFGCDICQEVCPWNRKVKPNCEPAFQPDRKFLEMNEKEWFLMDQRAFGDLFGKSPLMRTGYKGIRRNLEFLKTEGSDHGATF